jgi:glutaminyl-peptide cyclotransferase
MKSILVSVLILAMMACKPSSTSDLGKEAYKLTGEIVAFGPRPPGSPELEKVREWIRLYIEKNGLTMQKRPFMARTPKGMKQMVNLSYVIPGVQKKGLVVLMAHYDSKLFTDIQFVGANDAASSVALLLTLTKPIQKAQLPYDVQVVFVDGEEAIVDWTFHDSLYGSRQMAQDVRGVDIKAVIVVDMIADKDLSYIRSRNVDEKLLSYFEKSLEEMNQSQKMETQWSYVMDDHTPFVEIGIPTLHIMDFTFGGKKQPGKFWHTEQDNMENISAESLSITGEAILRTLKKIN